VIQATLIFVLGFLAAVFLGVLVAPAIWRRAVVLTRRRIEATLPLSLNEIRADKDAMRAEYAMAVRRLEMTVKALKERNAAQSVEVDGARDEARRLAADCDGKAAAIAELELRQGALQAELVRGEEEIARLEALVAERDAQLEDRKHEIAQLGMMFDEASFDASNRQIEMVAQESKLDRLAGELAAAGGEREKSRAALRAAEARIGELDKALGGEKRRIGTLERDVAKLTAALSDREEKLDRRERDVERLRARLRAADESGREMAARLAAEQDRAERLSGEIEALRAARGRKPGPARGATVAAPAETALLRERIDGLAAEMVSLAAKLEGPDSEIEKLLAAGDGEGGLAGRIRALRAVVGKG
jgi:chromosome segregation ATPase